MTTGYAQLKDHQLDLSYLKKASSLLGWDMEVMMPLDSAAERSKIMSTLSALIHQKKTDPRVQKWLDEALQTETGPLDQRNLLMLQESQNLAQATPEKLIRALSEAKNQCVTIWQNAKATSDWTAVEQPLENLFALKMEAAQIHGDILGKTPYDMCLYSHARGNSIAHIDPLFTELQSELPNLLQKIQAKQAGQPRPAIAIPVPTQEKLARLLIEKIGFSFKRGRFDVSAHPFSGGTKYDSRITTRFTDGLPFAAIMGALHETGHALYNQNTPDEWEGMPIGAASDLSLHESQSLLIEKQVGLSPEFLNYLYTHLQQEDVITTQSPQDILNILHHVERDFIRVEANEVTYPLHVLLRYDIEKKLFSGDLKIKDIPQAWNESMKKLFDLDVPEHRLGCMQDIHWFWGMFGYFPTYTQGALYAAQIFAAVKRALPDVMQQIASGEFQPLMTWLKDNIHLHANIYDAPDLIQRATGETPTARYFLDHLKSRYLAD